MKKYFLNFDKSFKLLAIFIIILFFGFTSVCLAGNPTTINESVDLQITLTLEKVSGDNQGGCTEEALLEPFIIKIIDKKGNGVKGASITFSIDSQPSGASGASLSIENIKTNDDGKAETILTLGDKIGTYTVIATANDTEVNSGSPQTFKAESKEEKLKFGGSMVMAEPSSFQVYVPTKWGGKLTISTTDGTISDLEYPDGSPFTNGSEIGQNKHGWYKFRICDSKNYTVSSEFIQTGFAGGAWTCYWWPMYTGTGAHLYDIDGPLDKYDKWYVAKYGGANPGVRDWEFANHRTTDPTNDWWGHCNQRVAVVIHQTEPSTSTEQGISFSELDKEGLLVSIWEEYDRDFVNLGSQDDPDEIHKKLIEYIKNQSKKLGIDTWHDEYEGTSRIVWNYVLYGYSANMVADGTDNVGRLKININLTPFVQDGPIYTYEYTLVYDETSGDISSGLWKYPETIARRPDIIWRPSSPKTPPSPIDPTEALDIVY